MLKTSTLLTGAMCRMNNSGRVAVEAGRPAALLARLAEMLLLAMVSRCSLETKYFGGALECWRQGRAKIQKTSAKDNALGPPSQGGANQGYMMASQVPTKIHQKCAEKSPKIAYIKTTLMGNVGCHLIELSAESSYIHYMYCSSKNHHQCPQGNLEVTFTISGSNSYRIPKLDRLIQ